MRIDDYDEWYYNRPQGRQYRENEKIWQSLAGMIECLRPSNVFEFGSGLGHLLQECSKRQINIIGSETSRYAILNSLCKERIIRIGEIDQCSLPFKNDSFDLVFSSEVMEHVKEPYTEAVIRELRRICSKRALLTINTFDREKPGHINMHSRDWWLNRFEKNGFRHNDQLWTELGRLKYLNWDLYVFDIIPL